MKKVMMSATWHLAYLQLFFGFLDHLQRKSFFFMVIPSFCKSVLNGLAGKVRH